jgi:hypothetical protein
MSEQLTAIRQAIVEGEDEQARTLVDQALGSSRITPFWGNCTFTTQCEEADSTARITIRRTAGPSPRHAPSKDWPHHRLNGGALPPSGLLHHQLRLWRSQTPQNWSEIHPLSLGKGEKALQVYPCSQPQSLQLSLPFADVASVAQTMPDQFTNLPLNSRAEPVGRVECLGLLPSSSLLQIGFVGTCSHSAARLLAPHTPLEQRAGLTGCPGKGEQPGRSSILLWARLPRSGMSLRASCASSPQVNLECRLVDLRVGGLSYRRDQVDGLIPLSASSPILA